jgi:hypothetical protein
MREGRQKKEVKKVNMVDVLPIQEWTLIFKPVDIIIRKRLERRKLEEMKLFRL